MNKFDERYEIRLAKFEEIEIIMEFIDQHWRQGHIMSKDRALFEYEYVNEGKVNIILAIERNRQTLDGIFGFIECSNTNDIEKKDVWGSIWKVVDTRENMPFLGIELAKRAKDLIKCRMHIGNGANPKTTIPLRKMFFKETVGKMKQYYLLNPLMQEYHIAVVNSVPDKQKQKQKQTCFKKLDNIKEVKNTFNIEVLDSLPYKDNWYFEKRYFLHPYYKYEIYGLCESESNVRALLVCREVEVNGNKVLRIVDYFGEESIFAGTTQFFYDLMASRQIEYVDFFVYGFDYKYIEQAGFSFNNHTNIIPNYFEPFNQSNVDIWVHHKDKNVNFFKADGDQDRPNKI